MQIRPWTVLLYAAADNDRQTAILENMRSLEQLPVSDRVQLVAQVDRQGVQGADRVEYRPQAQVISNLGSVDMADPKTLTDFVQWGTREDPAENTALFLIGPGEDWRGGLLDFSHGKHLMTLPQIEGALKATGQKLALLGVDGDQMGCAELAYQVRDCAQYLVASEAANGPDWPYRKMLAPLASESLSPLQLASSLVHSGSDVLRAVSAIDLNRMGEVGAALQGFSTAILWGPEPYEAVASSWERIVHLPLDHGHDLADFAHQVDLDHSLWDPLLRDKAQALVAEIEMAVVAETHTPGLPGLHGLAAEGARAARAYQTLALPSETGWGQATLAMHLNS